MNLKRLILLLVSVLLLFSCKKHTVDFSYTPAEPTAGQTVTFNNLSSEGEKWAWTFGDGATSTSRTPTHVYRRPGQYVITLMMDSSKHRMATREITIYDTVPAFHLKQDSIVAHTLVSFEAELYNPFNRTVKYEWILPQSAVLVSQKDAETALTESSVSVYFENGDATETVELKITIGDKLTEIKNSYYIHPATATSLLFIKAGQLYRQRLFDYGTEEPLTINLSTDLDKVETIIAAENNLYLFPASETDDAALTVLDMQTGTVSAIVTNSSTYPKKGFYRAMLQSDNILWTTQDNSLFSVANSARDLTLSDELVFARKEDLVGQNTNAAGGIGICSNIYFLASDKGVYRFAQEDIASSSEPSIVPILTDYSITQMQIDPLARKIYFVSASKVYISNVYEGAYAYCRPIDDCTGTMWLDQQGGFLYYSHTDGIKRLPLIQTPNNNSVIEPIVISTETDITALTVDNIKR